ncbi:hypothetical protein [Pleomorphomonas sp. JP5]|uniref:glycine-rich domain-containing protein n=1 Tax=Pleomorphomonas sp. JP5 TaxID=2942998 RepID=UPI002044098F|nr:hypothetical protein [Pleomorphomonas sp. JP5]MCM5558477.1 hypothetical protein [Pleomorphomonas sp. JP5]
MSTSPIPPVLDQDRYAAYQPTAATTDFALGFPLFGEAADVSVYLDGDLLELTSGYTIRSTANGATLTPAPVTDAYVRLNAPISAGKLEIFGNFRPRRTIQATAPYGTRDFNFAFSLLMAAMREMWTKFTRSLKVPVGEGDLTLPAKVKRSGQLLGFDIDGNPVAAGGFIELTTAAATATAAAKAAVAASEAAQTFDPSEYASVSRKLKVGSGLVLDGVAGTDAEPAEADLTADLAFTMAFAPPAVTIAGERDDLPVHPAGLKAAFDALGSSLDALLAPTIINATGSWEVPAGLTRIFAILFGGGGGGANGAVGGYTGGYGGFGGLSMAVVDVTPGDVLPVTIGAGGNTGVAGGDSAFADLTATGGGGGSSPGKTNTGASGAPGTGTGGDYVDQAFAWKDAKGFVAGRLIDFLAGVRLSTATYQNAVGITPGTNTPASVWTEDSAYTPGTRGRGGINTSPNQFGAGGSGGALFIYPIKGEGAA